VKSINVVKAVVFALVVSALPTQSALAYFDPNVGGQLFQILAIMFGVITGILLFFSAQIRLLFGRLRRLLRKRADHDEEETSDTEQQS
jgi:hypothetical protein